MIVIKDLKKFNEIIVVKGFSKRALAKESGISQSSLIQISNGKQSPRPETAKKICEALRMGFDDLFNVESENRR